MSRATALSEVLFELLGLTKRGLFLWCGKLVGHYPVAGWLRLQCSFLKRMGCGGSWDAPVGKTVSNRVVTYQLTTPREQTSFSEP